MDKPLRVGNQTIHPLREKCVIEGCGEKATCFYLLLEGGPAFCSKHQHRATEFGADFSGPDDFDIPVE